MITVLVSEDNKSVTAKINNATVAEARFVDFADTWLWSHNGMKSITAHEGHEFASCVKHLSDKIRDLDHLRLKEQGK
jgi:hypothetical protein